MDTMRKRPSDVIATEDSSPAKKRHAVGPDVSPPIAVNPDGDSCLRTWLQQKKQCPLCNQKATKAQICRVYNLPTLGTRSASSGEAPAGPSGAQSGALAQRDALIRDLQLAKTAAEQEAQKARDELLRERAQSAQLVASYTQLSRLHALKLHALQSALDGSQAAARSLEEQVGSLQVQVDSLQAQVASLQEQGKAAEDAAATLREQKAAAEERAAVAEGLAVAEQLGLVSWGAAGTKPEGRSGKAEGGDARPLRPLQPQATQPQPRPAQAQPNTSKAQVQAQAPDGDTKAAADLATAAAALLPAGCSKKLSTAINVVALAASIATEDPAQDPLRLLLADRAQLYGEMHRQGMLRPGAPECRDASSKHSSPAKERTKATESVAELHHAAEARAKAAEGQAAAAQQRTRELEPRLQAAEAAAKLHGLTAVSAANIAATQLVRQQQEHAQQTEELKAQNGHLRTLTQQLQADVTKWQGEATALRAAAEAAGVRTQLAAAEAAAAAGSRRSVLEGEVWRVRAQVAMGRWAPRHEAAEREATAAELDREVRGVVVRPRPSGGPDQALAFFGDGGVYELESGVGAEGARLGQRLATAPGKAECPAYDPASNAVVFTAGFPSCLYKLDADNGVCLAAGSEKEALHGDMVSALAADGQGSLFLQLSSTIKRYDVRSGLLTRARIGTRGCWWGLVSDLSSGTLFAKTETSVHRLRTEGGGGAELLAGSTEAQGSADGRGTSARFWEVGALLPLPGGNLLIADGCDLRCMDGGGTVTTLLEECFGKAGVRQMVLLPSGEVAAVSWGSCAVTIISGGGFGPTTLLRSSPFATAAPPISRLLDLLTLSGGVQARSSSSSSGVAAGIVTIRVGAETFPAHRSVLAAGSEYFARLLSPDGGFADSGAVEVVLDDDAEPAAFAHLLSYMYCNTMGVSYSQQLLAAPAELLRPTAALAGRLLIGGAVAALTDRLAVATTPATVLSDLLWANTHGLAELQARLAAFAMESRKSVDMSCLPECLARCPEVVGGLLEIAFRAL
ncbi:hypothetical protein HYH03_005558 [Edaphochlamys debaryana]|uniref:BTB domain-containing protein n=1 Tax=Edaphochlamys debaryana TaxID=47281 RepID=A0A835Y8T7_9CHLO|nr:hypothetical protein HYH03_005558 [Edaphochlamys debaryana]|eukprot:KAG2496326.1 hypothetical protein HYH03_005558 [Edaphochlamys debaryana]